FCLLTPPLPRSTLFPYTTLFRSNVYLNGQHDWNVHGKKFVRMSNQLTYDSPPLNITWDTVRQIAYLSLQQHSHTTMGGHTFDTRSEEHTSELQSRFDLVCRLLLE